MRLSVQISLIFAVLAVISIATIMWLHSDYHEKIYRIKTSPTEHELATDKQVDQSYYPQQMNITAEKRDDQSYYPQLKLAISLLNALQKDESNENILFSPHSVYRTLLLAYFGAAGETENAFKNALGLNWAKSKVDIERLYKLEKEVRAKYLQNQTEMEFISVDKLFVSKDIIVRDSIKKIFNNSMEELDFFNETDESIKHINEFVRKTTRDHIKQFIPPNSKLITNCTVITLFNVAYFQAKWKKVFNKQNTKREIFYKQNGQTVYVDMMHMFRVDFDYASGYIENLKTELLKMPFQSNDGRESMFNMYILLSSPTAIEDLLGKLTPQILDDVFSGTHLQYNILDISLPKFSFEKAVDLKKVMTGMGMQSLFDEYANFTDFYEYTFQQFEIDMVQKAKIEVNEVGATAAATTMYSFSLDCMLVESFNCNHPFIFMIYDEKFKEILYAGIYHGPDSPDK